MKTGERSDLPRRLGFFSTIAVVIGSTIGSGIFRSPAAIAERVPSAVPLMAVWVVGGLVALCGALTLGEVASALPRTGGIYVFLREGWGRLPAFLFGWAELVIIRAAALGAVAITFTEYAFRARGYEPTLAPYAGYVHDVAAIAIIVLALVNILGVRWSALVLELSTVAKYGALLFIVTLAFVAVPAGHPDTAAPAAAPIAASTHVSAGQFGLALVAVLWAYDGWADLSFIAGEVSNPRRNLPRALIGGTAAVIAIYLAANVAYLAVLPVDRMRASTLIAADVAQQLIGSPGVLLVGLTVVLATLGTLNGSLLTAPRIFFAMADDGLLYRPIAAVHPRFRTPYLAIALSAVLGVIFVLMQSFEQLADLFITAIVPFYALAVASVFTLRRRPGHDPAFRVPWYPVVPAIFILAAVYLLASAVIEPASRWPTLAVFGVILLGAPVYGLIVRRGAARTVAPASDD